MRKWSWEQRIDFTRLFRSYLYRLIREIDYYTLLPAIRLPRWHMNDIATYDSFVWQLATSSTENSAHLLLTIRPTNGQ
jgi:hypothetical protein